MDRYRLIEPLGTGGMSVVWRGFDEVLGRAVAVKVLAPKLLADPRSRGRIQAEARAAALLSHPHVAAVHDFGHTADGEPFVVMELITGQSLEAVGRLPTTDALRLGAQLASALAAVHARGLVHRDVKPANVMLTADGAKLVDFGISAIAGDTADLDDEVLGTPAYLAPERLQGLPTTAATDVYGLGLVIYETLTGWLPWPAETTDEMLRAHRRLHPAPLPTELALPKPIAAGILRCLAKAPENRPTADDMFHLLSIPAAVPPVPALATRVLRQRPRLVRAGVGAGVLALSLGMLTMCAAREPGAEAGEPAWIAAAAAPAPAGLDCLVRYTVRAEHNGAFAADLTLTNTGTAPVPAWTLAFRLPDGQSLGSAGTATLRQDGPDVRLSGATAIAPGAEQTVALTGSYRSPQTLPSGFTLNDTACQQVLIAAAPPASPAATQAAGGPPAPAHTKTPKKKGKEDDD
jgi:hypothetical protein